MVAGHVEERHRKRRNEPVERPPLTRDLVHLPAVALDEVADAHHELGSQEIDALDPTPEDTGPMAAGPVGHDGELKVVRTVSEVEMRPRRRRRSVIAGERRVGGLGRTWRRQQQHHPRQPEATARHDSVLNPQPSFPSSWSRHRRCSRSSAGRRRWPATRPHRDRNRRCDAVPMRRPAGRASG